MQTALPVCLYDIPSHERVQRITEALRFMGLSEAASARRRPILIMTAAMVFGVVPLMITAAAPVRRCRTRAEPSR